MTSTSPHTTGENGNGSGLAGVAVTGPYHRGPVWQDLTAQAFPNGDHALTHKTAWHNATSLTARLVPVYLRLAVGIPELVSSLEKFQHLPSFVALWHRFHLPEAHVLAPAYAAAELFGALLLLIGWQTRTAAALFVAELLCEILVTKRPLANVAGWAFEWQSLLVVLILLRTGPGQWSLDGRSARLRVRRAGDSAPPPEAWTNGHARAGAG